MDPLSEAREALARQDWVSAHEVLLRGHDPSAAPIVEAQRLDLLAGAAWWLGHLDECIDARERAYVMYDELDERRPAGLCAVWLYEHHSHRASPVIAGGWLRRARRALDGDDDCVEYGALLLREVEVAHGAGEFDRAIALAEQSVELGRRLRAVDLEAEALQSQGRVLIDAGDPTGGLERLDEAMLFALDGRLSPYSTGKVYCSLITACEELSDLARAAEWTVATARWAERHPFAIFPGLCRVHHATALQWRGRLAEAEAEAARACAELAEAHLPNAAAAWAEIGDIRRRLGDLDGAEAAFAEADSLSAQPRGGLALLRLAQGRTADAASIITDALERAANHRLARAKLLPARAQIAVADGDLTTAEAAVEELEAIADAYSSDGLHAAVASARGRIQLAAGDPGAVATLRLAVERWREFGVPYEVATASTLLGQAYRDRGDAVASASAFDAARVLFDELGIRLEAREREAQEAAAPLPAGLTQREAEVLRLVAAGHTNKEIAGVLFLSDKTIARHLSNIFTKLGVSTRSAATAFAFEHDVVGRSGV